MSNFLDTYKNKLNGRNKNTLLVVDKDLPKVLSAVVLLLRRHNSNNQLCCDNNVDDLEVEDVDSYGFVTEVTCTKCKQTVKTTCHEAKWTYERIYDELQLNPGDHICWHRPCAYWHHAVVTSVEHGIKVIHYDDLEVTMDDIYTVHDKKCRCLDVLYRINYEDCYDADYTVLRACKLLNESRYNLLERNCEHFSRWCKTGSTNSSQVMTLWLSLGKMALMIGLRVIALLILAILAYLHEAVEDNVRDRKQLETTQKWLIIGYMAMITLIFITYSVTTSCSRLGLRPERKKCCDIENRCQCSGLYDYCTKCSSIHTRRCCCLTCCCFSFFCRAPCCFTFSICRNIYRRPLNLAAGLLIRIVLREILAAGLTALVLWHEEQITDTGNNASAPAEWRMIALIALTVVVHVGGYIAGIILGRLLEALCEHVKVRHNRISNMDMTSIRA